MTTIDFLATPFGPDDVDRLVALKVPALKLASTDLNNWPLLRHAQRTRRPLMVSTGASTAEEIEATVTVDDEVVATLGPGDVVGELSMVDGERASATVTADGDCTIWLIARAGFLPVFESHPEMAVSMLHAVVARLRAADEIISAHRH